MATAPESNDRYGDELEAIRKSREFRLGKEPEEGGPELSEDLFGVAFSGGGIRSATFNLGVLQALARRGLLRHVDYLSTVSGGGYIGSWLQAWISREDDGVKAVERELAASEPEQVSWLRRFSNYLTPRLGLFGADTWAVIAIYLRNLLLTQTAFISGIALVLTVAWALYGLLGLATESIAAGAFGLFGFAALAAHAFSRLGRWDSQGNVERAPARIQVEVVLPLIGAAVFASIAARAFPGMGVWSWAPTLALVFAGCWTLAASTARNRGSAGPTLKSGTLFARRSLVASALSGLAAGAVLGKMGPAAADWSVAASVVALPATIVLLFALAATIQVGLIGRRYSEPSFEWWGRLGGWLLLYAVAWAALFGLTLYGSSILAWFAGIPGSLPAWIVSWGAGLLAARSGKDHAPGETSWWKSALTTIAPYAFVGGMLVLMAAGFEAAVNSGHEWGVAIGIAIAVLVVWRFSQINRLSMHGLYRNRLVRCYLGASSPKARRRFDVFTGFSPDDDIALANLRSDRGPFAIVNAAVNLASTTDLAWQERKAASFSFTPQSVGYTNREKRHYRPTADYGGGYSLGSAMTISGAAASPNMGFRTSAPFAFLMSMFNIRLGWWSGNPNNEETYRRTVPERFGFAYLMRELLGTASSDSPYVYLSDGGHFENLGLYELVARGCRYVIVSDAGCDPKFHFDDLGNAVRKCRTDLGVEIEIDVHDLVPEEGRTSARHCAVGTIHYPHGPRGTLLYLKSSITGDEPADVRNYAAGHPHFPHQTTGDQWFAESQFESYRKLGRHVADVALERAESRDRGLPSLFTGLRYGWFASARASSDAVAEHADALDSLVAQLREEPLLAFLDRSFWPEWEDLAGAIAPRAATGKQAPSAARKLRPKKITHDEFRAGFYFCLGLIQLMENVFHDLELGDPEQRRHPDNRGWMNLFRHFSWAGMFRMTWAVSAATYGARFQNFCRDALDLDVGDALRVETWNPRKGTAKSVAGRWKTMLKRVRGINFHERDLLGRLLESHHVDWSAGPLTLATFRIAVADPSGEMSDTDFGCGFAVIQSDPEAGKEYLCTMRIPDHLRKMGLARRALIELTRVLECKPEMPPRRVAVAGEATELSRRIEASRPALTWVLGSFDA